MIVLEDGHLYLLKQLDSSLLVELRYAKRIGPGYPGNQPPAYPGLNNQEVLRSLIHRTNYLNGQDSHWINRVCVFLYRVAINLLEYRAAQRHHKTFVPILHIEIRQTGNDGHIL